MSGVRAGEEGRLHSGPVGLLCSLCPPSQHQFAIIANQSLFSLMDKPEPWRPPRECASLIMSASRSPSLCSRAAHITPQRQSHSPKCSTCRKIYCYITSTRYQKISSCNSKHKFFCKFHMGDHWPGQSSNRGISRVGLKQSLGKNSNLSQTDQCFLYHTATLSSGGKHLIWKKKKQNRKPIVRKITFLSHLLLVVPRLFLIQKICLNTFN